MAWFEKEPNRVKVFFALIGAYAALWILGMWVEAEFPFYTLTWVRSHMLAVYLLGTLLLAGQGKYRAAVLTTAACPIGVALGELIGGPLYLADVARHEAWAREPGYVQTSSPLHYGWLIAILVYLAGMALGLLLDYRKVWAKRQDKNAPKLQEKEEGDR